MRGNQSALTPRYCTSGSCMPSRNAVSVVQPNEVNPPTSAAVSAGTTSAGITTGSTVEPTDATRMPSRPVTRVDRSQLTPASRSGE